MNDKKMHADLEAMVLNSLNIVTCQLIWEHRLVLALILALISTRCCLGLVHDNELRRLYFCSSFLKMNYCLLRGTTNSTYNGYCKKRIGNNHATSRRTQNRSNRALRGGGVHILSSLLLQCSQIFPRSSVMMRAPSYDRLSGLPTFQT